MFHWRSLKVHVTCCYKIIRMSHWPVSCQDAWPELSLPPLSSPRVVLCAGTDCSSENNTGKHEVAHNNSVIYPANKGERADFTNRCIQSTSDIDRVKKEHIIVYYTMRCKPLLIKCCVEAILRVGGVVLYMRQLFSVVSGCIQPLWSCFKKSTNQLLLFKSE